MEKTKALFNRLALETDALLTSEWIANLSNFNALLFTNLPDLNWVGFYLARGRKLYLGPFQGKVACTEIDFARGVCGACATTRQIQRVKDVHQFPGHIACDPLSRSEIVVPIVHSHRLLGVLDLDSPILDRFSAEDAAGLQVLVDILVHKTNWPEAL